MASQCTDLHDLGETFVASSFDWGRVKAFGISIRCLHMEASRKMTCGKILAFSKDEVTSFREKIGIRLCCFKFGVTSNPITRFEMYQRKNFTSMWVIWMSDSLDLIHMLEAALVLQFHQHVGCQNKEGTGGEGFLNSKDPPAPPFFLYVTGGRADQPRRVG